MGSRAQAGTRASAASITPESSDPRLAEEPDNVTRTQRRPATKEWNTDPNLSEDGQWVLAISSKAQQAPYECA